MTVIAIDQGTTSTRALLLERSGKSRICKVIEHRQFYPQVNWVEHDPDELIKNIKACIDASCSVASDVSAIGIDNQGESCLAWHADTKQALSPVIVWQDSRTQDRIEQLKQAGVEELVLALSGLPLDTYFSASKLAWLVKNNEQVQSALQQGKLRLGTTDAFFLDRLTGQFVTDITTASRTSLMNLETGEWDQQLCDLFDVPMDSLPKIVATTGDFGVLTANGKEIPVTASVCDQQASLYGHGCRDRGDTKITFGTGAFALSVTGEKAIYSPKQGLLPTVARQCHEDKSVYALDGGVYAAGAAINWTKSLGLFQSFDEINAFKSKTAIEKKLVFVPALSGLACPHWDRKAAGLWLGLSLDTTSLDMMQAVLEGIIFRASEVISAMGDLTLIGSELSIDGGLSSNPYFCQFLANVLNKEIRVQQFSELTAIGTALLASNDQITVGEANVRCYYPQYQDSQIEEMTATFSRAIERSKQWY